MKNLGFLLAPALTLLIGFCWALSQLAGWPAITAPLLVLATLYLLLPLADAIIGNDHRRYREHPQSARWLNALPPAMLAFQTTHVGIFLWLALASDPAVAGLLILAAGIISSVSAINSAHELVHRPQRWKRVLGGLLLCTTAYPGFKIEHVRGHHRWVATPHDASSAPKGMSLYRFLPRALLGNTVNAWRLAEASARSRSYQTSSRYARLIANEAVRWWCLTGLIAISLTLTLGWLALVLWLGHSLVAILTLETINYVEHYGLRRKKLPNGQYEAVSPRHSWNCSNRLSNWMLLGLQRHSDHHAHAGRAFPDLRHQADAPQLPAGYAAMMLLALVPPLWFRIMDSRLPETPDSGHTATRALAQQ